MPRTPFPWRRAAIFGLLLTLAAVITPPVAAQALSAQFVVSAAAGPAGSLVFSTAVDSCPATPAGMQQEVEFFFTDAAGTTTGMGGSLTDVDGNWGPRLGLQVPYHRILGFNPVSWQEEAATGPGEFKGRCIVYQSGERVVTQDYAPVPFNVDRPSLRFSVTDTTIELGETVRLTPIDSCLPSASQGTAYLGNFVGDFANAPLPMTGGGAWEPVSLPTTKDYRGGQYKVGITCYTLPDIYTMYADVLIDIHRPYLYASLGDSYSSGEGNAPYDLSNQCHRSSKAWPSLVAASESVIENAKHSACSGAKASGALLKRYKGQPAQIPAVGAIKPSLVTITIGGNDVGFGDVLTKCYVFDCVSLGTISAAKTRIVQFGTEVRAYYQALKNAVPGWSRIIIVGYPRLFPENHDVTTGCGWLEPAEREGLNEAALLLDQQLAVAAGAEGLEYVSTLDALEGHELCRADSWLYPIKANSSAAAHPNGNGQQAMASRVRATISGI